MSARQAGVTRPVKQSCISARPKSVLNITMWVDRIRSVAWPAVLLLVMIGATWTGRGWPASDSEAPRAIVVELFASQGCSACPPANQFLAELA